MAMPGAEVLALKETLCAQEELLQQLQNELEAEREASASAASEALSVILRLQGEKAAVKMEAEQYKRLAEERMCHAEESFAVIEDIIEERDMEVAALDYQVQTYRGKLVSMGWDDDMESPPSVLGKKMNNGKLPRRNSEPVLLKFKEALSRGRSPTPEAVRVPLEEAMSAGPEKDVSLALEKKGDISSREGTDDYSDTIKKLNVRVRQITGENSRNTWSPPLPPRKSSNNLKALNETTVVDEVERMNRPRSSLKECEAANSHCSPGIFDVFEVPRVEESCGLGKSSIPDPSSLTDGKKKKGCQEGKICETKGVVPQEAADHTTKGEHDWLKKLLETTHDERHLCKPSEIAAIQRGVIALPTVSGAESESNLSRVNRSNETDETVTESKSSLDKINRSLVTNEDATKSESSSSQVSRSSEADETFTRSCLNKVDRSLVTNEDIIKAESSLEQIDRSLVINGEVIEAEFSLETNEDDTESEPSLSQTNRSLMTNEIVTEPSSRLNQINWSSVTNEDVTESDSILNSINSNSMAREVMNEPESNLNRSKSSLVTNETIIESEPNLDQINRSLATNEVDTGSESSFQQIHTSYVTNEAFIESELPLSQPSVDSVTNEDEMPAEFISRAEQLKLLKEINDKLNLLHAEIRSQETEKPPSMLWDQISLPLPEAMLYFWL